MEEIARRGVANDPLVMLKEKLARYLASPANDFEIIRDVIMNEKLYDIGTKREGLKGDLSESRRIN